MRLFRGSLVQAPPGGTLGVPIGQKNTIYDQVALSSISRIKPCDVELYCYKYAHDCIAPDLVVGAPPCTMHPPDLTLTKYLKCH